jgi:hypothetical protein
VIHLGGSRTTIVGRSCAVGALRSPCFNEIGLDPRAYGTHSLRRTKASLIYRRTKNLRDVQLKLESAVRYLGIEVDDALEITEQTDI